MKKVILIFLVIFMLVFIAGCKNNDYLELKRKVDLVVYTPLDESIYGPIIKEYEKRRNVMLVVQEKSQEELFSMTLEGSLSCDFILGVGESFIDNNLGKFSAVEYFSYYPMVIFYNTKLVRYNEAQLRFDSLTDERWRGKIAFLDPQKSEPYARVIDFGESISKEKDFRKQLELNLEDKYFSSIDEIASEVAGGNYYIGVITQDRANELIKEEKAIAYIASTGSSYIIYDLGAILKNASNIQEAKEFMDFILSDDAREFMQNYLDCSPPNKVFGGYGDE